MQADNQPAARMQTNYAQPCWSSHKVFLLRVPVGNAELLLLFDCVHRVCLKLCRHLACWGILWHAWRCSWQLVSDWFDASLPLFCPPFKSYPSTNSYGLVCRHLPSGKHIPPVSMCTARFHTVTVHVRHLNTCTLCHIQHAADPSQ